MALRNENEPLLAKYSHDGTVFVSQRVVPAYPVDTVLTAGSQAAIDADKGLVLREQNDMRQKQKAKHGHIVSSVNGEKIDYSDIEEV